MFQCSNFSSNIISGFAKIANLSNDGYKDETRMHLVQGNCNKMVTSAMPPSLERREQ